MPQIRIMVGIVIAAGLVVVILMPVAPVTGLIAIAVVFLAAGAQLQQGQAGADHNDGIFSHKTVLAGMMMILKVAAQAGPV
jgi:hypothetical protein